MKTYKVCIPITGFWLETVEAETADKAIQRVSDRLSDKIQDTETGRGLLRWVEDPSSKAQKCATEQIKRATEQAHCARCNETVGDHGKSGTCPDGKGSFTFTIPRGPSLIDAIENIRRAAKATGHSSLEKTAADFISDVGPTEAPDWKPEGDDA